jgi:hypothetical protein
MEADKTDPNGGLGQHLDDLGFRKGRDEEDVVEAGQWHRTYKQQLGLTMTRAEPQFVREVDWETSDASDP